MAGLRELLRVDWFCFFFREEDWLVTWLRREKGIKRREGHYRNFTIPYHSYLGTDWEMGGGQVKETSSRT